MPAPLAIGALGLSVGKLVFDTIQTVAASDEVERRRAAENRAIEQQMQQDAYAHRVRSESRLNALNSLIGQSNVAFASSGIVGGTSVGTIQRSLALGAAASQEADERSFGAGQRVARERQYGINAAARATQRNLAISYVGSFLESGKDIGTTLEWWK